MAHRTLIVNADDLGYDPAVTRGILRCMREGIVSSATLMVNTPFSEDAAGEAKGLSVGLHFNLARGAPLSQDFPQQLLSQGALSEPLAPQIPPEVVAAEALAQLQRLEELLGSGATHIDVHKHLHRHRNVWEGLCSTAAAQRLPVRSIDAAMRSELRARRLATPDHFFGDAGAEPFWTLARLENALRQLPEGVTELMCHPGYAPTSVQSGYAKQREVEMQTFLDPRARTWLEGKGIRLAGFGELHRSAVASESPS